MFLLVLLPRVCMAGEADIVLPQFSDAQISLLSWIGYSVCILGMLFSAYQYKKIKNLPSHSSMTDVSSNIYNTCKAYMRKQGKLLMKLFVMVAIVEVYYFWYLQGRTFTDVLLILLLTIVGMLGSYTVAWFGIRINTIANNKMAFSSLENKPIKLLNIPLDSGMAIGVMLVSLELSIMISILLFMPRHLAGVSFIGFAIGESLAASVLRIAGGIFTKIADVGADMMKNIFHLPEDSAKNPAVIADCTGDNAGDSVGPTADGFETYGVTGVALIVFIVSSSVPGMSESTSVAIQTTLLMWMFMVRVVTVITSVGSWWINRLITNTNYRKKELKNFEAPLTSLVWITSISSIVVTYMVSYWMLSSLPDGLWITFATLVSLGTFSAACIPELTKLFTSMRSAHVQEIVNASREGASLTVLAGLVAGYFSAFWKGLTVCMVMFVAMVLSMNHLSQIMGYPLFCAFGLVAFGLLNMGPVTIATDSYGPVTDNSQSIYELSLVWTIVNIKESVLKNFGFTPNFERAKYLLELNDSAGNTFKATAKPVLIATAAIGTVTMIFSLILLIKNTLGVDPDQILSFTNGYTIIGSLMGGAFIYWFSGANIQAVSAGASRAVDFIKRNITLDANADSRASNEASKRVVEICTEYAQKGMLNIFCATFFLVLAISFFSGYRDMGADTPAHVYGAVSLFISFLLSTTFFGLLQAISTANAGGALDNAKKHVEVVMAEKNTPLHEAVVTGDIVGDPLKDTLATSINPIIKFSALFGVLGMSISTSPKFYHLAPWIGAIFLLIALLFIYRSFYKMRAVVS